ncbi:hypothetical protein CKO25_00425 [Thiocapsa imhoffii]|uniref:Uncharacterized protein n=1 Tax=Thiocapsa imhoffii TaxID=382777 RepID=A0A9X1B6Z1_9GAMM|nr:hypothetical protein [Thiocapsa imhoffii]MBK1643142.1 hypothetical protein [Thiocapsa imhoffii]
MDKNKALFEAMALQAEASGLDRVETMAYFSNQGLPLEVVTRMDSLWDQTVKVGEVILNIGKIILLKLVQFVRANPNMAIGFAIGLALGMLTNAVPYIGPIIAPIMTFLLTAMTALRGHRLDKVLRGEYVGDSIIEDLITITKQFWSLLWDILNVIVIEPVRP